VLQLKINNSTHRYRRKDFTAVIHEPSAFAEGHSRFGGVPRFTRNDENELL